MSYSPEMLQGFDDVPTAANAKFDKIDVKVGIWTIRYRDPDDFEQFVWALQPMSRQNPVDHIDITSLGEDGANAQFGWMFNNRRERGGRIVLDVRTKDSRNFERIRGYPLFAGKLVLKIVQRPSANSMGIVTIEADLLINPTRFAHHQDPFRRIPFRISSNNVRRRETSFPALDGNDNVLLGESDTTYSTPDHWRQLVRGYWSAIVETLDGEFERAIRTTQIVAEKSFSYFSNTSKAQVYWEVAQSSALGKLEQILPLLQRLGRESSVAKYPTIIRGREVNCPSASIRVNQGLSIRVYAKTEDRLRFELDFDLKYYPLVGGRTSTEIEAFPQLLQHLAALEFSRISGIFSEVLEMEVRRGGLRDLMEHILTAADSNKQAKTLLNLLISNGGITPTNSEMKKLVRRLKERNVLIGSRIQGAAVLAPEYIRCLQDPI